MFGCGQVVEAQLGKQHFARTHHGKKAVTTDAIVGARHLTMPDTDDKAQRQD
jgi:hypothetical protein